MKLSFYLFIFVCVIASFSSCSSKKNYTGGKLITGPAAADIVTYVNQGLIAIRELELRSLESYASVTGENATTNKILYETLGDFIVPTYKRYVTGLKKIPIENQEVMQVHALFIKAAEARLKGWQTIMIGLENNNEDINLIELGNKKLEEASTGFEKYYTELNKLCKKHGVAFLRDDQTK